MMGDRKRAAKRRAEKRRRREARRKHQEDRRRRQEEAERKAAQDLVTVTPIRDLSDLEGTAFTADTEPLTAELIDELVSAQGWDRQDLEAMAAQGFEYSRERNSLISPWHFESSSQ